MLVLLSLVSLGRLADGNASGVALEWARLLVLVPALPLLRGEGSARGAAVALAALGVWSIVGRSWWIEERRLDSRDERPRTIKSR